MLAEGMGFLETATGLCSSSSGLFGVGGGLFLGSPGGREGGGGTGKYNHIANKDVDVMNHDLGQPMLT